MPESVPRSDQWSQAVRSARTQLATEQDAVAAARSPVAEVGRPLQELDQEMPQQPRDAVTPSPGRARSLLSRMVRNTLTVER